MTTPRVPPSLVVGRVRCVYETGATGNVSLMGFTRALGGYALDDNIRVVGINPGPVNTDRIYTMLRKWAEKDLGDPDRYQELAARYPLGRPAHCSELSDLPSFLASGIAGYTTGIVYTVDCFLSAFHSTYCSFSVL